MEWQHRGKLAKISEWSTEKNSQTPRAHEGERLTQPDK